MPQYQYDNNQKLPIVPEELKPFDPNLVFGLLNAFVEYQLEYWEQNDPCYYNYWRDKLCAASFLLWFQGSDQMNGWVVD